MAKIGRRFKLTKSGKIERQAPRGPDAAALQRQRPGGSKKVRVAKRLGIVEQIELQDCIRQSFMRKGER